ncbi:MAG: type I 3-dehydroquinate dehydratase, partial [Planctomycetota bacterium]
MAHHTLLAVVLVRAEPPLCEQVSAARRAGADLVELRVDCINDEQAVAELLAGPHELPFILTIRARAEGGQWNASEARRAALLAKLAALRPEYIDIEYACQAELMAPCGVLSDSQRTHQLMLSHHNLHDTPNDLDPVFEQLSASGADVIKAVFTAHDATCAFRVLEQLRRNVRHRPTIALAMGEAGVLTRVLAAKYGAFLTFARLEPGVVSASGQPTIHDLMGLYRWRE